MKFDNRYSRVDRLLHRIAFSSGKLQASIADLEETLHRNRLKAISIDRPVFLTALPRAGTTVLLNLLVNSGAYATHTYRDMPFVICPMLWRDFASRFYKADAERERAHGDGLKVSLDSPEAFEEIIWRLFSRAHYTKDRILPWTKGMDDEFVVFFKNHIRKIIAIRSPKGIENRRYASKNNLNIARLKVLPQVLPDCEIIVPFRDPLQHAASLLNQHKRFLELHRRDRFAKTYMQGIGHYDFGENLMPVDFDGWVDGQGHLDATELSFWLQYWIATYRYVLSVAGNQVHLLSYAALTDHAEQTLDKLASLIGLDDRALLTDQATVLRSPRNHEVDISGIKPEIIEQAQDLYIALNHAATETK